MLCDTPKKLRGKYHFKKKALLCGAYRYTHSLLERVLSVRGLYVHSVKVVQSHVKLMKINMTLLCTEEVSNKIESSTIPWDVVRSNMLKVDCSAI